MATFIVDGPSIEIPDGAVDVLAEALAVTNPAAAARLGLQTQRPVHVDGKDRAPLLEALNVLRRERRAASMDLAPLWAALTERTAAGY